MPVSTDTIRRHILARAGVLSLAKTPSAWNWPACNIVTSSRPQASWTGMLRFGKLLIRKVARKRGVLTRDK
jgi:hypothetical protein